MSSEEVNAISADQPEPVTVVTEATDTATTTTTTDIETVDHVEPPAASSRTSSGSGSGNGNGKRERVDNDDDEDEEATSATKQLKSSDDSDNTTSGGDVAGGLLSGRSSTSVDEHPNIVTTTDSTAAITSTETKVNDVMISGNVQPPQNEPVTQMVSASDAVPTTTNTTTSTDPDKNPSASEDVVVGEVPSPVLASTDVEATKTTTTLTSAAAAAPPVTSDTTGTPVPSTGATAPADPRVAVATTGMTSVIVDPISTITATTTAAAGASHTGGVDPNAVATISNPEQMVEETGVVSAQYVGRVIGKGGEMIRDLQARSGARIDVDQNVPIGQPRVITYRGTRETVDFAKHLVQMLSTDGVSDTDLPLGNAAQEYLIIPAQSVGKVIGRGGEMIRELQSRSHAKIQIDHSGQSGIPTDQKQVTITGTHEAVIKGKEMVLLLVANPLMDAQISLNMLMDDKSRGGAPWGSGPPYMNLPNQGVNMQPHMAPQSHNPGGMAPPQGYAMYGQPPPMGGGMAPPMQHGNPMMAGGYPPSQQQQASMPYGAPPIGGGYQQAQPMYMSDGRESELLFVSKQFMGRIIGSKGVTINDLQRRSQCDIQINQDVQPGKDCEITVKGTRQGIDTAKAMIQEIIEVGPHHPYAGGIENYGTKNVGGGYHGGSYAPQQQQQQQQRHAQYNPYQQPQQSYDQGGAYGQSAYAPQGNPGYAAPIMGGPSYGQPMQQPQQAVPYQQQQQQQQQQQLHQTSYGGSSGYTSVQPPQQIPTMAAPRHQPPAPQPVAPVSFWKAASSPDGQIYYYNERTGETQWEKPPGMP